MEEQILALLGQKDYAPANVPEMLRLLRLSPNRQQELQAELRKLEQTGLITRTKGNRYIKSQEADLIPGQVQINRQGKGFLRPDDAGLKEIMIPQEATGTALHGDRVLVRRNVRTRGLRPDRGASQETGSVIRILERKRSQIVGTLQRGRQFLYVIPDDPRMPHDIYVPEPRDVGRKPNIGDKVVVELLEWESRHNNPEGEIIEVLGRPDEEGVDMLSVLRQYNLPLHFPKPVLNEANAIGNVVHPRDLAGREDCREHMVITIDPDDAKDFDDAIALWRVSLDQWKLWVHIADVSHYVKPGSALDVEARKRGNSTYLVDRVIPMLPEALSNELCSLKPNVDRLTKCVEFLVANDGRVLSAKFYPAVIHSKRRFTYKEVFEILQRPPNGGIEQMLHDAHELAQNIRRLRFKAGSLALDFPETKIRLDEQGRVLRIEKIENDVSHQLIEEYMLLANEAVASRLMSQNQKAIYRVHEEPDERRLNEYREDVLSHHVPCGNLSKRPEVSKLLQKLDTLPIGAALKIGFLRSLMRARYAVEPLGHYGLAKAKYTHFTSPIRRYADLVVHRALFTKDHGLTHSQRACLETTSGAVDEKKAGWRGATKENTPRGSSTEEQRSQTAFSSSTRRAAGLSGEGSVGSVVTARVGDAPPSPPCPQPKSQAAAPFVVSSQALKETAEHISDTERNSADAERDSKDVKMYAFLKAQLAMAKPPVYPALVTDVRNFGFFVDVTGLAMSGLIHCSSLTDDFYEFDEARGTLTGRRNRRVIQLGDKLQVQIAKVDSFKKQVDFRLAREERKERDDRSSPQERSRQRQPERRQERQPQRPQDRQQQRPQKRFEDRQQPRGQSRPQQEQRTFKTSHSQSGQPQTSSRGFKTQYERPQLSSGKSKSQPARPQGSGNNFKAGSARPQIPSSHSRSKFGGRRRRR